MGYTCMYVWMLNLCYVFVSVCVCVWERERVGASAVFTFFYFILCIIDNNPRSFHHRTAIKWSIFVWKTVSLLSINFLSQLCMHFSLWFHLNSVMLATVTVALSEIKRDFLFFVICYCIILYHHISQQLLMAFLRISMHLILNIFAFFLFSLFSSFLHFFLRIFINK